MDEKNELLNALNNAFNYYSQFNNSFQNLYNANCDLKAYMSDKRNLHISTKVIVLASVLFFFLGYLAPIILSIAIDKLIYETLNTVLIIVATALTAIIIVLSLSFKKKEYNKTIEKKNAYMRGVNKLLFDNYINSEFQIVPYEYCEPCVIKQLIFYIESCRADTLEQAIDYFVSDVQTSEIQHDQLLTLSVAQQDLIESRKI